MNIDTERVIAEVHLRPCLWDLNCDTYKDRDAKTKAWHEIFQEITGNYDDLSDKEKKIIEKQVQQRWKTARDAYVRCKSAIKTWTSGPGYATRKKYVYFDCMHFLDKNQAVDAEDPIPANGESQSNKPVATIDADEVSLLNHPSHENVSNKTPPPSTSKGPTLDINEAPANERNIAHRKRKRIYDEDTNFKREMFNIFKENFKLMQNDDMSFFYSLLPIMGTFSNHQKLLFRSEVLKKAIEISSNNSSVDEPGTSHTFVTSDSQESDKITLYSNEDSPLGQPLQCKEEPPFELIVGPGEPLLKPYTLE